MLKKLKEEVFEANMALPQHGLVTLTWGNVSAIDREKGLVVIKPSGVKYSKMKASDMVVVDLKGNIVEGDLRPSSDTTTHLVLYNSFANIGGIVHTHSTWATAFAQAKKPIPAYGTTHADHFYGEIPCTRDITRNETEEDLEYQTGKIIAEAFDKLDPMSIPAVLVACHGPFAWGNSAMDAVENAIVLEAVAEMAHLTYAASNDTTQLPQVLLDHHYFRKHGENSYYGQL